VIGRGLLAAAAVAVVVLASSDAPLVPRTAQWPSLASPASRPSFASLASRATWTSSAAIAPQSACEGARDPLPDVMTFALRASAFPDSTGDPARADVAVHVPPGFDATRRPGLIVYFHGWSGCVEAALSAEDRPCADGGEPRPASALAAQIDDAGVNALLVAIELRVDMPTGEPGRLAMPGGLRDLLRELFAEHLAAPLGCALEVDGLDRVVLIAHSGGYQAACSALALGDVPRLTEIDLLDALYGGDDLLLRWIRSQAARFDRRASDRLRLVDLYTCCGGTAEASRALGVEARAALGAAGLAAEVAADDASAGLDARLAHSVVLQQVPAEHAELPRVYLGGLVRAAGFARTRISGVLPGTPDSHSLRPN
jgi:hypothetical protein